MYSMRISVIFQMGHVCGKFITYPETKLSVGGGFEEDTKQISSVSTDCDIFWWFLEALQGCVLRKFEFEGNLLVVP